MSEATPFYRTDAFLIAVREGVMAGLHGDKRWGVLCALYNHLPNVHPGKDTLTRLTGCSASTVDRALKSLRQIGLIGYTSSNPGGQRNTTHYTVADIRNPDVLAKIITTLEGAYHEPLHSGEPPHHEPLHSDANPPTMTTNPPTMTGEPPYHDDVNPPMVGPEVSNREESKEGRKEGSNRSAAVAAPACARTSPANTSDGLNASININTNDISTPSAANLPPFNPTPSASDDSVHSMAVAFLGRMKSKLAPKTQREFTDRLRQLLATLGGDDEAMKWIVAAMDEVVDNWDGVREQLSWMSSPPKRTPWVVLNHGVLKAAMWVSVGCEGFDYPYELDRRLDAQNEDTMLAA